MNLVLKLHLLLCLKTEAYTYYGTNLDNMDHLNYETNHHTSEMTAVAAQFAGQMALRLAHNHLLSLDVSRYSSVLTRAVVRVYRRISQLSKVGLTPFMLLFWFLCKLFMLIMFFTSSHKDHNTFVLRNVFMLMLIRLFSAVR